MVTLDITARGICGVVLVIVGGVWQGAGVLVAVVGSSRDDGRVWSGCWNDNAS